MEELGGGHAGGVFFIGLGGGIFAAISASAMVDPPDQLSAGALPDEGFGGDLLLAAGAFGQIEGLEVGFQAFLAFAS